MSAVPAEGDKLTLAVLVTCYNRVETSVASLRILQQALSKISYLKPTVFVIDDGSPDRTGERLKAELPDLVIGYGDGSLFWNGGMCCAYQLARAYGRFDAYLLFNDDVTVDRDAMTSFFQTYRELNGPALAILAGSTRSRSTNHITYSAFRRLSRFRPMAVAKIIPDGTLQQCDSFNGNFVLVPGEFFEDIGGLDPHYSHAYGDIDLGYVAARCGVARYLHLQSIGWCEANAPPPKPHGWRKRLQHKMRSDWTLRDSLGQRAHFIRKHTPLPIAAPLIALTAGKRLLTRIADWLN